MLVLSRKVGERILVGDKIRITVVRVSGGGVRLGIEAPSDIPVIREEVLYQQEAENEAPQENAEPSVAPEPASEGT